jgi:hypothetical protein
VHPRLPIAYQPCDRKPYFPEGRGRRTGTTFRHTHDSGSNQGVSHLPYRPQGGRHIHRRLREVERVSHHGGRSAGSRPRVVPPAVTGAGGKAPGLRFGKPGVRALCVALTLFPHRLNGLRQRDRREQVAALLGSGLDGSTPNQMTCDRRRLLRPGILGRQQGTSRYFLPPPGGRVSGLFARLEARVFRPLGPRAATTSQDFLRPCGTRFHRWTANPMP